ncbi:MAG: hypothetical protein IJ039_09160 [Clostridia bacterium]|nr:hypothetical protein [Clostridia bacterium]
MNDKEREERVIVSLTSMTHRINCVHLAIKSLMLQTYKPDRIVLWLVKDEFPNLNELPKELLELQKYGLEIIHCSKNLYGHKKYFYALKEQKPNEVVITYDDDIIYPVNSIELLMKAHTKYKSAIVCNRAQACELNKDGSYINPGNWKIINDVGVKGPSYNLCPSTGGGCLYPYDVLYKDYNDEELLMRLADKSDDLWIMFMAAANGTPIVKSRKYHRTFTAIEGSQIYSLAIGNIVENGYDAVMKGLIEAYPEAWKKISTVNDGTKGNK